ncbi:hypothetical protein BMF94_2951 [Rhodotorula taiwanensis]|uniref:Proteasome assembly chaperone 3 n=1 Tax=Rhodotorula taiwanensis TaxID=741276 RepID=A0A2S5BBI5_9BASI|nr:hypothetical protein BMF94_2951 [Rhodotorula taiwanensis]
MASLIDDANLDLASTPGLPPVAAIAEAQQPSAPPPSAIPTAQRARTVNGVHTEVLVQVYADRILVIVTQLGRIGCMIQVSPPPPSLPAPPPPAPLTAPANGASSTHAILASLPPPHPSTVLSPLFGVPPDAHLASLHDLYAAQIGAIVFRRFGHGAEGGGLGPPGGRETRPVVLGIGIKPASTRATAAGALSGSTDEHDDEDGGGFGLSERDKETFAQVMDMVSECLV